MGQNLMLNYTGQNKIWYAPELKETVIAAQQSPKWLWLKSNCFRLVAVLRQFRAAGALGLDGKGLAMAQTPTRPPSSQSNETKGEK